MLAGARVTPGAFRVGAREYRALLLDPLEVAEPALVERVARIAGSGVPVLALGALPRRAPGLRDASTRDERVRAASKQLAELAIPVPDPERLEGRLAEHVRGSLVEPAPGARLSVSLERRRSGAGETLLVFNESRSSRQSELRFTRSGGALTLWDPRTGRRSGLRERVRTGDLLTVLLEPAEATILTLEDAASP
jgi:hypothetical protein